MLKTNINISCPRCYSKNLSHYGKHPKTKEQKFICKNCSHQFVPGHTRARTHHGRCPKCGSNLHIRKTNKSTIQLRCSNRLYCRYSISRPIHLEKYFKMAISKSDFFTIPKFFKFPVEVIILTLKLYYKFNLSSREIKNELKSYCPKPPSHVTIVSWSTKFAYYFSLLFNNNFKQPSIRSTIWLIDETVIKIKGIKYHLFTILDYHTRFIIAWYLSPTKDLLSSITLLNLALKFTKYKPKIIISDYAQHFQIAIEQIFNSTVKHIQVSLYEKSCLSNNRLERFYSTIKQIFKRRKVFKSYISAFGFIFLNIFIYNFFRPHSSLEDAPPANILNLTLNIKDKFLEAFKKCFA